MSRRLHVDTPCCTRGPRQGKKHQMQIVSPRPAPRAATFMRCRWCWIGGYFYTAVKR